MIPEYLFFLVHNILKNQDDKFLSFPETNQAVDNLSLFAFPPICFLGFRSFGGRNKPINIGFTVRPGHRIIFYCYGLVLTSVPDEYKFKR